MSEPSGSLTNRLNTKFGNTENNMKKENWISSLWHLISLQTCSASSHFVFLFPAMHPPTRTGPNVHMKQKGNYKIHKEHEVTHTKKPNKKNKKHRERERETKREREVIQVQCVELKLKVNKKNHNKRREGRSAQTEPQKELISSAWLRLIRPATTCLLDMWIPKRCHDNRLCGAGLNVRKLERPTFTFPALFSSAGLSRVHISNDKDASLYPRQENS